MHLVFFPIRLHRICSPVLISAVFLLAPVSFRFLILEGSSSGLRDVIPAICRILPHYWIGFRSPWYQKLGQNDPPLCFFQEGRKKRISPAFPNPK
ncbi:MAG: hypothetical protein ACI4OJ_09445 [Lachnospiraceae bacterium]